jgi:hypothetical protein
MPPRWSDPVAQQPHLQPARCLKAARSTQGDPRHMSTQKSSPSPSSPRSTTLYAVLRHPILFLRYEWQIHLLRLTDEEVEDRACLLAVRILAGAGVPACVVETPTGALLTWTPVRNLPAELFDLDRARLRRDGKEA